MAIEQIYYIKVTDTYGDDLNYSWTRRYAVRATSERGAMRVVGNHEGTSLRYDGWVWRYVGACIAAYVLDNGPDPEDASKYQPLNF